MVGFSPGYCGHIAGFFFSVLRQQKLA